MLFPTGCAVKKNTLSPNFYSSGSKVGLILITNRIRTFRTEQQGFVVGLLTMNQEKYKRPLSTIEPYVNPEDQFKNLYLSLLKSKGKNITLIDTVFDEDQFNKFIKPDNNNEYFEKDIRSLKDKYQVDEVMIVEVNYGINITSTGQGGYCLAECQIINLKDNFVIYKSRSMGSVGLKGKFDTAPDYENWKTSVTSAIKKCIELEKNKY